MKIFWSWQDDVSPKTNRHFIKAALEDVVAQLAGDFDLDDADRPALDHDTKGALGAVEIMPLILEKIASSAVFVADVTPVGKSETDKMLPNPNVMVELGWSMAKPGWERQIYVLNAAWGAEINDLPFDIRGRRVLRYSLAEGADTKTKALVKKQLVTELTAAIRTNLSAHLNEKVEAAPIEGVAADPNDSSIWQGGKAGFEHHDTFAPGRRAIVRIPDGPRAYLRVIPSGWKADIPSVAAIGDLRDAQAPYAPARYSGGDFGATAEGYVRYWISSRQDAPVESSDVMMFFEDTGEFWMLDGSSIYRPTGDGGAIVSLASVLNGWATALRRIHKVMETFGALPTRRVDVGFTGLNGARLTPDFDHSRPRARRDAMVLSEKRRDWDALAVCDEFLVKAFGKSLGLFGLAAPDPVKAAAFIANNDPERRRDEDQ